MKPLKFFCGQIFFIFVLITSFGFCQTNTLVGYKAYFKNFPLLADSNGNLILENILTDCHGNPVSVEGNPLFLNFQGSIYLKGTNGIPVKKFGFVFINESKPGTYDNFVFTDDQRKPLEINGSKVFLDSSYDFILKDGCSLLVDGSRVVHNINFNSSKLENCNQVLLVNNKQLLLPDGRNATVDGKPVSLDSKGMLTVNGQVVNAGWNGGDVQVGFKPEELVMVKADGNMVQVTMTPTPEDTTIYKDFDHQHHLWNKIMANEKFYEGKHLEFLVYMHGGSVGLYDEIRPYWIGSIMNTKTGEVYSDTKLQIVVTPEHSKVIDKDKKKKIGSNEYEIVDVEGQMGYASPDEGDMRIFLDKMVILKKIKIDD